MPKQTVSGQQKLIDDENKTINNLLCYYKDRKMTAYEKSYIKDLEKRIEERKEWIKQNG